MDYPTDVTLVEVGPRDGLQNEKAFLALQHKIQLIDSLSETGLTIIEAGSFVNPKWVPQMKESALLYQKINKKPTIDYPVLIPNKHGLEEALAVKVKSICVFTAVSETFSQKNTNCSIEESIKRIQAISQKAKKEGLKLRGYISCAFGCPYEGKINEKQLIDLTHTLLNAGCYEVSLGDTIGVATPGEVTRILKLLEKEKLLSSIAMHFHNTYGQALANILMSLQFGISTFDASVAGLGGCPYAKGATGNVATEDVVYMLQGLNIQTGIDLNKLINVGHMICQHLNRENNSHVARAVCSNP